MKVNQNIEEILKRLGGEDVPADVHKIAEETSKDFSKTLMQTRQPKHYVLWEYIMESRITKLAAAAAIIIVALFGISQLFRGTVTFADVIQPILNARTVVFDLVMGKDETGPVIHDIVAGSRIRRTFSNMDTIQIIDLDNAKMLALDPKSKGAFYMDIKGHIQEGTKNLIEFVRKTITDLKDLPVEELGQQNIDGLKAIGFKSSGPNEEVTIWADSKTAQPIRIEIR